MMRNFYAWQAALTHGTDHSQLLCLCGLRLRPDQCHSTKTCNVFLVDKETGLTDERQMRCSRPPQEGWTVCSFHRGQFQQRKPRQPQKRPQEDHDEALSKIDTKTPTAAMPH